MPRRILKDICIEEISAVDRPAQEGAKAVLLKRAPGEEIKKGPGDVADVLTSEADGHQHGIHFYQSEEGLALVVMYAQGEGEERSHDHAITVDMDGNYQVAANAGHSHELDSSMVNTAIMRYLSMTAKADSFDPSNVLVIDKSAAIGDTQAAGEIQMSKDNTNGATEAKVADLEKQLAVATALASMSDVQKAHYNSLDEAGKDAFVNKSDVEREEVIKNAQDADPIVYKSAEGVEFRKSDDQRLVELAKRNDAQAKEMDLLKAAAQKESLAKRASETMSNLPGDQSAHMELLKAVDGIGDEAVRSNVQEMLKAADDQFKTLGQPQGTQQSGHVIGKSADGVEDANAEMNALAKKLAEEKQIPYLKAYEIVGNKNPQLLEAATYGKK